MHRRWLYALFSVLLCASATHAAPPTIDAAPVFNEALVPGYWQPLAITLQNPAEGEALQGEVQVSLEESRSGARQATYTAPITLPRGAGTTRATLYLYVGKGGLPEFTVYVVRGRSGDGAIVTRRRFDKIPATNQTLGIAAVSENPDTLGYLQGETLGVFAAGSVLRPAVAAGDPQKPGAYARQQRAARPVRLTHLTEPGRLPDRAIGYDTVSLVYLGPEVTPDAFSDAQVAALRGRVASGGVLVTSGAKLRTDERFRAWLPLPKDGNAPVVRALGSGTIAALAFDPAAPPFAGTPAARALWRTIARSAIANRSIGQTLVSGSDYSYNNYASAVLHAPGLNAPGYSSIGLFLLLYLFLLVPLNYVILKRLDKREWSWLTVPALVVIFSVGAYSFGYATKGTSTLLNTASIVEMGTGTGDATTHTIIGIFSPARQQYQVGIGGADALAWSPITSYYRSDAEYGPLIVAQPEGKGAVIRDAEISMWAMRTFATRTSTIRFGNGIHAALKQGDEKQDSVVGTITNRTGRTLEKARLSYRGYGQELGTLRPDQTVKVALSPYQKGQVRSGRLETYKYLSTGTATNNLGGQLKTIAQVRSAIEAEVAEVAGVFLQDEQNGTRGITLTAWNYDPVQPVQVNGETVKEGANVSLLVVTLPPLHGRNN